jgi:hypothetical protein
MSKLSTRTQNIKSKSYRDLVSNPLPTKGLVSKWIVHEKKQLTLILENTTLKSEFQIPGELIDDANVFDFAKIRGDIRDIDIPETEAEIKLLNLESTFFGFQLIAFQFYKSLTDEDFHNSFFTRDVVIKFKIEGETSSSRKTAKRLANGIQITEFYYDRKDEPETNRIFMM